MSKYDIVGNLMHWLKCIELHIYLKTNILSASLISFEMNINRLVTTSLMPSTDKLLKTVDCRIDMCFLLTAIFQDKWYIIKLAKKMQVGQRRKLFVKSTHSWFMGQLQHKFIGYRLSVRF